MRIYIAGPYSKPDPVTNTALALRVAEQVWRHWDVPYVPHLTMFWHFYREHSYGEWLEYDRVWLRQCEALLRIPGESNGADTEVEWARHWNMPIFEGLTGYFAWKGIVPEP
jgi:hypothetical protein